MPTSRNVSTVMVLHFRFKQNFSLTYGMYKTEKINPNYSAVSSEFSS